MQVSESWRTRALCCGLAALLCALSGCASGRVNLWPVYFHEVRDVPGPDGVRRVSATDVLYPFFTRETYPEGNWHALRPFYNYESGPTPGRSRVQYLWPLGLHFVEGGEVTHRLFPFFDYNRTWSDRLKRYSIHAHLLQIIRWGNHAELGPYFAVFPFGGIMHGVVGRTWKFIMFPFYSHYERGTYVRRDFPWPFIGYGDSDDGSKSAYRFWPLYAYQRENSRTGLYERSDAIWPLVRWGVVDRGGKYYHRVLAVVPFFSRVTTFDREGKPVVRQTSVLGVGVRHKTPEGRGTKGWAALWSLIRRADSDDVDSVRFFPFYSRTTYYASTKKDPAHSWTRWIANPAGPPRKDRRITLWPLITWDQRADGQKHVWVVSHGWRDESKGYKRNYRGLLDFFQYHRDPSGERETRVLSRLYHHRRGPHGRYISVMGLFTYDSTAEVVGEDGSYFSALFGLLKRSWSDDGGRWRILYIPLGGSRRQSAEARHARIR